MVVKIPDGISLIELAEVGRLSRQFIQKKSFRIFTEGSFRAHHS